MGDSRVESRRRATDRRKQPRFEVVGDLWGTLDIVEPLPMLNIGSGGALVEADQPWPVGSVHSVVVANGAELGDARICVRHLSAIDSGAGVRYRIGVEFLSMSPMLAERVTQWLAASGSQAES
jgi:hypothetical protein